MDALAAMFREVVRPQDALLLLPVYDAGGTADRTVASSDLAAKVAGATAVGSFEEALEWISSRKGAYGGFAVCGARDPFLPDLARRIANAVSGSKAPQPVK